jgi:hypothetical protein
MTITTAYTKNRTVPQKRVVLGRVFGDTRAVSRGGWRSGAKVSCLRAGDGQESPVAVDAFEFVFASVGECGVAAEHRVAQG